MALERSLLFVPGSDPGAVEAAQDTVADAVVVDFEDTVAPGDKDAARDATLSALADWPGPARVGVRINGLDTDRGIADVEAVLAADRHPDFLVIPDVRGPDELRVVDEAADEHGSNVGLLPLIEQVDAVFAVRGIAHATPRISGLSFAAIDFQMNMGMSVLGESDVSLPRYLVSMAASSAGVPAFDKPLLSVDDAEALRREAAEAKRLGYDGKLAVDAEQAGVINEAFTPSREEIEEARRVIGAFEAADGGLVEVDGTVVDKPVIEQLRGVLARAERAGVDVGDPED